MGDQHGQNTMEIGQDPTVTVKRRSPNPDTQNWELWTVDCPYCGGEHTHGIPAGTTRDKRRAECMGGGYELYDCDGVPLLERYDGVTFISSRDSEAVNELAEAVHNNDRPRRKDSPSTCPACAKSSVYSVQADLYFHLDGSDNRDCHYKILTRRVEPPDEVDRFAEFYLTRSALEDLPKGEPLIENVLDRHALFVVSGRDQTFKSFLVLDWLACLASGHPWFGRPAWRTKVLYVVGEGAWGLNDRVAAWEASRGIDLEDEWFHVRRAPVNLFHQTEQFADLLARVELEGYGVVLFDTLQRMSSGADQNSARDAGVIITALDKVRHATANGSVGVVAHSDKGDRDTRGSSAFEDDSDIVWRTKRDEDEESITVTLAKRKDGPDGLSLELRPEHLKGTGSLVLNRASPLLPESRKPPAQTYPVLKLLASNAIPGAGLSATPIAQALSLSGRGQLYRALDWLMDAGYVQKMELGQHPSYKITNEGVSQLAKIHADQQ